MGCRDLDAILDRRRDPSATGPVLDALAALAPHDELAARTLLQALLPGLVRLGRRHAGAVGVDEVIGLAWERIRTYPATRRGSVAGNVVLDVRKALWRQCRQPAPCELTALAAPTSRAADDVEAAVLGRLFLAELSSLHDARLVTRRDLTTVVRTRLLGEPVAELAAESGVPARVLCQRRWRTEIRLRAALRDWGADQVMRCSAA